MYRSSSARCAASELRNGARSNRQTTAMHAALARVALARIVRDERRGRVRAVGVTRPFRFSFTITMTSSSPPSIDRLADRLAACLDPAHLRRNEPMAPYTTFKIGGPADLFFEATSADALANAVLAAREVGVPYFVLGLGANVLIGDRGFRGLVIRNTARAHEFRE